MSRERRSIKRPFGVTVIALLLLVNGVLSLIQLGRELYRCAEVHGDPLTLQMLVDTCSRFSGVEWVTLPFTLLGIVLAWGLWTLRPRVWVYTMFVQGIFLAVQLYDYFQGEPVYLNLLVSVFTVLYLNQSDVQNAFRGQQTAPHSREKLLS